MAEAQRAGEWVPPTGNGYWSKLVGRKMVEAWRSSGEPKARFAKRHGLTARRVAYWAERIEGSGNRPGGPSRAQRSPSVAFAPVRIVDAAPETTRVPAALDVIVGAAVVRVPPGFDEAHLRRVVLALGGGA